MSCRPSWQHWGQVLLKAPNSVECQHCMLLQLVGMLLFGHNAVHYIGWWSGDCSTQCCMSLAASFQPAGSHHCTGKQICTMGC